MVRAEPNDWKRVFREDVESKIVESLKEFDDYRKEGHIISLQQACNKLFSAVENYLMLKYDHREKDYQNVKKMVRKDKFDAQLLAKSAQLHYFYYDAELQMDKDEAEVLFQEVLDLLKKAKKY